MQKYICLEIRSKVKNHHISEAGVSFEIQFGLWIKIWAGEHIVLQMAANYRLKQTFNMLKSFAIKQFHLYLSVLNYEC